MKKFKKWLAQQIIELDKLHDFWLDLDNPTDTVEFIVQEAADRASKLGLLDVCRKSHDIKQGNLQEARWFLGECLRAIKASKSKDYLSVTEAARLMGVSRDNVLSWIHSGRLQATNTAKGFGRPRWKILLANIIGLQNPIPEKKRKKRQKIKCEKDHFPWAK